MRSLRSGNPTSPSSPASHDGWGAGPLTGPGRGASGRAAAPSVSPWPALVLAARIPTLPAAVVPELGGSAAAGGQGHIRLGGCVAVRISALLIQIGNNYANDLCDFNKGADTEARLGPVRATQAGLLTEAQMARGTWVTYGLALIVGLYLVAVGGWPILVVGLAGIAAGVLYTA